MRAGWTCSEHGKDVGKPLCGKCQRELVSPPLFEGRIVTSIPRGFRRNSLPTMILEYMQQRPGKLVCAPDLCAATGRTDSAVRGALSRLTKAGHINRMGNGAYTSTKKEES